MTERDRSGRSSRRGPRARARESAVVVVLVAGALAITATSPPLDEPCPSTSARVSDFYGAQDEDRGGVSWQVYGLVLTTGPFTVSTVKVEVNSCVAEHTEDGRTPVDVVFQLTDDGSGPDVQSYLRAALLIDGEGRASVVRDVKVAVNREGTTMRNGLRVKTARLRFDLPLDVPEPVLLQLPDLDGADGVGGALEPFPLRPEPAEPAVERVPVPTPVPTHEKQRQAPPPRP